MICDANYVFLYLLDICMFSFSEYLFIFIIHFLMSICFLNIGNWMKGVTPSAIFIFYLETESKWFQAYDPPAYT